jgi:serine/threonine-protein kinase RsbW
MNRDEKRIIHVTFRLMARLTHRAIAIDLLSTLLQHVPAVDADFRNAVTTAFSEAYNNVVIHAYAHRNDGMLEVEVELASDRVKLTLRDTGASVDLSGVAVPDLDSLPEGGLGLYMMRALMDEVVYQSGPPNVLCLTKRTEPAT